jgi:cytochrome c peroxidase
MYRLAWGGLAALALLFAGCQPAVPFKVVSTARPFPAPAPPETTPDTKQPAADITVPPDYGWMAPAGQQPDVPLVFVTADQEAWGQLKDFWNPLEPGPGQVGALTGGPLLGLPLAMGSQVRVRVPLGLDSPVAHVPAVNPPTRGKWQLGKQLFFDATWLSGDDKVSCAGCHNPHHGFSRGPGRSGLIAGMDTPTLCNCGLNRYQFWDGRALYLEEVVQRALADEQEPAPPGADRRHVWSGVVARLREPERPWRNRFLAVFGARPTADAVGKALGTYLRTILSGNALHDRAVRAQQQRGGKSVEQGDYLKVLDEDALRSLGSDPAHKGETARDLAAGSRLFFNLGERRANCVACHRGGNFTDDGFHNLGVGSSARETEPGHEPGRFAVVPYGLKDRRLIGAFKTPTLRGLPRTAPYWHDGSASDLEAVVRAHARGGALLNRYLDPEMHDLQLDAQDVRALVLFLKALAGDPVPAVVAEPPK